MFCKNDCEYLNITEKQQIENHVFINHYCNFYKTNLKHANYHPQILCVKGCKFTNNKD